MILFEVLVTLSISKTKYASRYNTFNSTRHFMDIRESLKKEKKASEDCIFPFSARKRRKEQAIFGRAVRARVERRLAEDAWHARFVARLCRV